MQTLCGITRAPQVEHFARDGTDIFHVALLLSLLAFEVLFFGHIDTFVHLLADVIRVGRPTKTVYSFSTVLSTVYFASLSVSLAIMSSSFVGTTSTLTFESSVEITVSSPLMEFFSGSMATPR